MELTEIIEKALTWSVDDNFFNCRVHMGGHETARFGINRKQLRTVHPYLPELFDAMLKYKGGNMTGYASDIPGSWVRATYKHLLGLQKVIETKAGPFPLDSIATIKQVNADNSVSMRVGVYRVLKWETPDGTAIEYAVDRHPEDVVVGPAWLDKHYPGWQTRLATANSLGLEARETVDYMCSDESAAPLSTLPDVTFE